MNKFSIRKRSKSYFYITEDPPFTASQQRAVTGLKVTLPKDQPYFFIDFTSDCDLRTMKKIHNKDSSNIQTLKIEQYGRNIITNMQDCSPRAQKLMKFQQQRNRFKQKKSSIREKLRQQLNKSKEKIRSNSQFAIKHQLIDLYTTSIEVDQEEQKNRLATLTSRLENQQSTVLKRLGLFHMH